ncbi:MAG: class I SAM-dependent methyltransferase [Planctomycetota bacterium]
MTTPFSPALRGVELVHQRHVAGRRARVLSQHLAGIIPADARVLDVGCGDGQIAWMTGRLRPDVTVRGVDVLVRPETHIPVDPYDGQTLPHADNACDVVTLIDVLHHCDDPMAVLAEATRVARRCVVVKDHLRQGLAGGATLRFMDWVGNHRHGVRLPYNYLSPDQWQAGFDRLGLRVEAWHGRLGLYTPPAGLLFDRSLHFLARVSKSLAEDDRKGAGR